MAGIVFWFQEFDTDVFSGRPVDLDAWRYAAKAGGVDKMRCVNESDISVNGGMADFKIIGSNKKDLKTWLEGHSDQNIVIFDTEWTCPDGAIPLSEIDHTEVDWYVFGAAKGVAKDLPHQYVYLPQDGKAALHSVHVASAVMLRRWEEVNGKSS